MIISHAMFISRDMNMNTFLSLPRRRHNDYFHHFTRHINTGQAAVKSTPYCFANCLTPMPLLISLPRSPKRRKCHLQIDYFHERHFASLLSMLIDFALLLTRGIFLLKCKCTGLQRHARARAAHTIFAIFARRNYYFLRHDICDDARFRLIRGKARLLLEHYLQRHFLRPIRLCLCAFSGATSRASQQLH